MRMGLLAVVPFALAAAGCFEGQRTFKVNADGSGTIVDTVKLGEEAKEMRDGLAGMDDSSSAADKAAKRTTRLAERAAAMGEGVTFVGMETTKDGGERFTYAFRDITLVRASAMPSPDESTTSKDEPLTFRLAKSGANTVLTVVHPPAAPAGTSKEAAPAKSPEETAGEVAMMKKMLGGLKLRSVVEVDGKVVKTSSAWAAGPVVTLLEIDFDQIDPAGMARMAASKEQPSPAEMKGVKGVKVSEGEVSIEFTGRK